MSAATTRTEVINSADDAVQRARALLPALRERAAKTEQDRCIPAETISELRAAGLLDLHKPRRFGGAGGGLADAVAVSRELASACLSSGWVQGVYSGHLMFLGHFPPEAQAEVYADPDALVSTVLHAGRADISADRDGFTLRNVEGRFCSGVDHCSWVLVGANAPGGERRFFMVPRGEIEIIDDWYTTGMRGTGSKAIRIAETHVSSDRSVAYEEMCQGTSPGAVGLDEPLVRQPVDLIGPYTLIGNSLGGAFGALDAFTEMIAVKQSATGRPPGRESAVLLSRLGEMAAATDAVYNLVLRDAATLDARTEADEITDKVDKARLLAHRSYAALTARRAVNELFEFSGASALYDGSPMQRWWRDVNAVCNHFGVARDPAITGLGHALIDAQLGEGS